MGGGVDGERVCEWWGWKGRVCSGLKGCEWWIEMVRKGILRGCVSGPWRGCQCNSRKNVR